MPSPRPASPSVLPAALASSRRRRALVLVCAVLAATVGAVPAPSASAAATTVTITAAGTSPREVTVGPGDPVTIVNDDQERHRLRSRDPEDVDTGNLEPGSSATVTMTVEGSHRFVDERTEDLADALTVTVAAVPPSSTVPDAADGVGDTADGGPPSDERPAAPSTADVVIPDRRFTPREVTITAGGTVTWRNQDGSHTVTADDGTFDSGVFEDGQAFSRTFATAGTVTYLCRLHPEMTGTVTVVGAGDGAAGATDVVATPRPATSESAGPTPPQAADAPSPSSTATPAPRPSSRPGGRTLEVVDFDFVPAQVSVPAGTTVTWVNRGRAPHTVTATSSGSSPSFDSGLVDPGASYRQAFPEAGTFAYLCTLHPAMTGRIVVTEGSAGAAEQGAGPDPQDREVGTTDGGRGAAQPSVRADASTAGAPLAPGDAPSGLPFAATVLVLGMVAAFVTGRVTTRGHHA